MHGSRAAPWVWPNWQALRPAVLPDATADKILAAIAEAARPVIIAGPQMSTMNAAPCSEGSKPQTGAPAVIMESPRGLADATLGAFPNSSSAPI